jgi:iron(III) transport system ATP-binding protein
MANLRLTNVTKRFGEVVAVNNLSLVVEQGECFSFLGPSGCGKTTTLRMIAGFEDLDEGEIAVGDRVFSSSYKKYYLPPERRDIGMVFQAFAVWPHLNVHDNVAFPLQVKKLPKSEVEERTRRALTYTGLLGTARSFPAELSGGQQQRIALARAIALNPQVMLLDEPLSNLDPKLREEMRFEIKELQQKLGFTIIFVTHDQAEAMALSDRMLVMDNGVVQQVDTPLGIYNHPVNKFVFSFIGLSNFLPAEIVEGKVYAEGALAAGALSEEIPADVRDRRVTVACRPSEIEFVTEGGVAAKVKRATYLGELVDYRILLGETELRVQKQRRHGLLPEGSPCRVKFNRLLWYDWSA